MWPVFEIGTPIFVAVFEGPIILLKICEVHLQVSSCVTYTVASTFMPQHPFFEKVQFLLVNKYICPWREKG